MTHYPCLILGAGAAGLMCAAQTPKGTLVVDHARAAGEKIRISGGGRCNFTNMHCDPAGYLSDNPHFAKSALSRYTQWDFIALVDSYGIAWHEKTLGQLFCDGKATQITQMLLTQARAAGAEVRLQTQVGELSHDGDRFRVALTTDGQTRAVTADTLVLATGGKAIPKMGATDLALRVAQQFGLPVTETRAGLVPFTFGDRFAPISGVATPVRAQAVRGPQFEEAMLCTHRGLSGPAMLQVSSYWRPGEAISVDLDPSGVLGQALRAQRQEAGKTAVRTVLDRHLPARLVEALGPWPARCGDLSDAAIDQIVERLRAWSPTPAGTEGYRTAEVMAGGIDTAALSSKTMESRAVPGLYAIGEAVDVTGWLGGYNFQWAWSSGWAAGQAIRQR